MLNELHFQEILFAFRAGFWTASLLSHLSTKSFHEVKKSLVPQDSIGLQEKPQEGLMREQLSKMEDIVIKALQLCFRMIQNDTDASQF